jgi:hypothetical protein
MSPQLALKQSSARSLMLGLLLLAAACSGSNGSKSLDGGEPSGSDAGTADAGTDAGTPDGGGGSDGGSDGGMTAAPIIRTVTPPRGPASGGSSVVFFGKNFVYGFADEGGSTVSEVTEVWFGSQQVAINGGVNVIDDETMETTAPPGTRGTVDIKLKNPNGEVVCPGCYTYVEDIRITKLSVTKGSTLGGEPLTIFGSGFAPGMLVLVGGAQATNVVVSQDGGRIDVLTPPGTAGSADVGVVGADNADFLRRSFVYFAPVKMASVTPPGSALAGGITVTIDGEGFTADSIVSFGGLNAPTSFVSGTQLKAVVPPANSVGAVDVVVTTPRTQGKLINGFAYFDSTRDPQIFAVTPAKGPAAGGTVVKIVGTGLTGDGQAIKFGAFDATNISGDEHILTVTTPAGAPGLVDVQARTVRGGAVLSQGFGYLAPLMVSSITPSSAPTVASPAVQATISGSGLDGCKVFIGGAEAVVNGTLPNGTGLIVTVPEGSEGPADVRLLCGDPSSLLYQEKVVSGGFKFTAPLKLLKIDPESGAIAGNTAVNLYGSGFVAGMEVYFGSLKAPIVDVKSPHWTVVRTPRGDAGFVDVKVKVGASQDVLRQAYGYVNPQNILGGGSGGSMRGILNVTVLNSTPGMNGPVPGATISINSDQLVGITDDRGQVTFSDPSLLKPVTITGSKPQFAAATIARIDARNVTLFMEMNDGEPSTPETPPLPEPATFSGRVCGFKLPPGTKLASGQRLEAHVYMSARYVYAVPPFRALPNPVVVSSDCGGFKVSTRAYRTFAFYAEFGIMDSNTSPPIFKPLIMGIKRGLEASPGKKQEGIDIVLDMHRDVSFPVNIDQTALLGESIMNTVYSYLDLGGEGIVPLAEQQSTNTTFPFENHPRVGGEGLILLNFAAIYDARTGGIAPPFSLFYRRQYGELSAGVTVGPMLAFTRATLPAEGALFTGSLAWSFLAGPRPDLQQLSIDQPMGLTTKPIWSVVLPGAEQSVSVPASAMSTFPPNEVLEWLLITAKAPRFDFNQFSYQQLGVNEWTAFTQDYGTFITSP